VTENDDDLGLIHHDSWRSAPPFRRPPIIAIHRVAEELFKHCFAHLKPAKAIASAKIIIMKKSVSFT
jgi:hypothetical protein